MSWLAMSEICFSNQDSGDFPSIITSIDREYFMALSNIFKSLGNAAYLRLIIFQILENKNGKMEKRYINPSILIVRKIFKKIFNFNLP